MLELLEIDRTVALPGLIVPGKSHQKQFNPLKRLSLFYPKLQWIFQENRTEADIRPTLSLF